MGKDLTGLSYDFYDMSDNTTTFCITYQEAATTPRDYGTGELYTMLEAHTITLIERNPGITVTDIARRFNRTTSSISQLISRLERKGLLTKSHQPGGSKQRLMLHVTKKGRELSRAHIDYDTVQTKEHIKKLLDSFSMDEINAIQRYFDLFVSGTFAFAPNKA